MRPTRALLVVKLITLSLIVIPMGAGQTITAGVTSGAAFGHCEAAGGPVEWQNGNQYGFGANDDAACTGSNTLQGSGTTLECAVFEGNKICLVANDNGLACEWEVTRNNHADAGFVPAYFLAGCKVSPAGGGGVPVDAHSHNAGTTGSVQVMDTVPTIDVSWSAYVLGLQVEIEETTINEYQAATLSEWSVQGSWTSDLKAFVQVVHRAVVGHATLGVQKHLQADAGQTRWEHTRDSEERQIRTRQGMMVGATNVEAGVVPVVETLSWSGSTWGCDSLDLVEEVFGPRQIEEYSTLMKTRAASSGEHVVDLDKSKLVEVKSRGNYETIVQNPNGFTATFSSGASSFSSLAVFAVDYDHEWLPVVETIKWADGDDSEVQSSGSLEVLLKESGTGIVAHVTDSHGAPPGSLQGDTAIVTPGKLAAAGSLAKAIVWELLADQHAAARAVFDAGPCGTGETESVRQPWKASGLVNGASTGASRSSILTVDVALDLLHHPSS